MAEHTTVFRAARTPRRVSVAVCAVWPDDPDWQTVAAGAGGLTFRSTLAACWTGQLPGLDAFTPPANGVPPLNGAWEHDARRPLDAYYWRLGGPVRSPAADPRWQPESRLRHLAGPGPSTSPGSVPATAAPAAPWLAITPGTPGMDAPRAEQRKRLGRVKDQVRPHPSRIKWSQACLRSRAWLM